MLRRKGKTDPSGSPKKRASEEPSLFELPPPKTPEPLIKALPEAIWTESKARLIHQYLYLFVQITKHGCYVDGFAGPQQSGKPETWAANLVLEVALLEKFHFFEKNSKGLEALNELKAAHSLRSIQIHPGDFNKSILKFLASGELDPSKATFCLLDQRTFECHWRSVQELATYKKKDYKIELFYFLANQWFGRAFSAQKNKTVLDAWWGGIGWEKLASLSSWERVLLMMNRFKEELGYKFVTPWAIREKKNGGHLMYYMIHATDHKDAPGLMRRAYDLAVRPADAKDQLSLTYDK